jgi:dihydrofolate reductase
MQTPPAARTGRQAAARFRPAAGSVPVAAETGPHDNGIRERGELAMGKIIVSENITLDGVFADPTGEEDPAHDAWFTWVGDADRAAFAERSAAEAAGTEALLLGRRTCGWFAERWSARTGAWADKLNSMPKYIASTGAEDAGWTNTTVLSGDVPEAVEKLKQAVDGDIVVYGSGRLARTLSEHDLIDEVRLLVYPVVVGSGGHLFTGVGKAKRLTLVSTQAVGEQLVALTYRRGGRTA